MTGSGCERFDRERGAADTVSLLRWQMMVICVEYKNVIAAMEHQLKAEPFASFEPNSWALAPDGYRWPSPTQRKGRGS
jgi:hypothetical protein